MGAVGDRAQWESGSVGVSRRHRQDTVMSVTLASSTVPAALATVQTWAGLTGWRVTPTWYVLPLTSVGKVNVNGPLPGRIRTVAGVPGGPWQDGVLLQR